MTRGEKAVNIWLRSKGWKFYTFQKETSEAFLKRKSGLLNAPTGTGKTNAVFLPLIIDFINEHPDYLKKLKSGLKILWITPLRALTKDLQRNLQLVCDEMNVPWKVETRTGDTSGSVKNRQVKKQMPEVLLITPESLHILFTQKKNDELFKNLKAVIVDEWHELLSTKRGVMTELALSYLRGLIPGILTWGISATIGNLEEALTVLLGKNFTPENTVIVRSTIRKKLIVKSVLPDRVEQLPWAGYLGLNLLEKVMPIVFESKSTLLFTNTRSQTEIWYRAIAEKYPELAGLVALHHGSMDRELRTWVEDRLHADKLKLVICTSSLDLGVDFTPVDTVIQVGSPKSVSRFLQRAGRSGHQPGSTSKIFFVPTHAMELIEAVSLREGIKRNILEERPPVINAFDVLAQYMVTLATGNGFEEGKLFSQITSTYSYQFLSREEWEWLLGFITTGGPTLLAYDEFRKVIREKDLFVVKDKTTATRHRLSIGTIVGDTALKIKFMSGKYLGTIEENFISRLKPGDVFSFAGLNLEFIRVREMNVQVKKAGNVKGIVPSWQGGRVPLSSTLSAFIREQLPDALNKNSKEPELKKIHPLLEIQNRRSAIPMHSQLLVEQYKTREGFHIFIYPFDGRLVHEGMASLLAWRIGRIKPATFSMAMNDYGFELLSDTEFDFASLSSNNNLFSTDNLMNDLQSSVNSNEMARRRFREIASIAGLVFRGFPGRSVKTKHLQASSSLLFDAIRDYEPDNLLIRQAHQESLDKQLEEQRMRKALTRISNQEIVIRHPSAITPFAFPILVDRFREQLSSEKMEDRINKLINQYKSAEWKSA